MSKSLTQHLSVADNERDAVHIHVSASSERQECRKEIVSMKKQDHILTHSDVCGPSVLCFFIVQHLVVQVI